MNERKAIEDLTTGDSRAVEIAKERELRARLAAHHPLRLVSDPIRLRCGLEYAGMIVRTARVHLLMIDEVAMIGKVFAPASHEDAYLALQLHSLGPLTDGLIDVIDQLYRPDEELLRREFLKISGVLPTLGPETTARLSRRYDACRTEAGRERVRARYRELITTKCNFG
jgi:hypothetical protein